MNPLSDIEFHSICIGEVGKGLQYTIGQKMTIRGKECVVSDIVRDENAYQYHGEVPYMVYANFVEEGENVKKCIKISIGQPIYISTKI